MISYLGSLVQFSPAAGRAGRCGQMSLCMGSTCRVPARQPAVLAPSPRVLRALSLRGERSGQPGFGALSTGAPRPFPPWPQRAAGSLRKSLDRNRGLFAGWEGVASLGLSLPLSPPPASYLQWGWAGSSLEFLSSCVLRTAGGVFRPVHFSLALPQFKKSSLRLLSGPSGWSLP